MKKLRTGLIYTAGTFCVALVMAAIVSASLESDDRAPSSNTYTKGEELLSETAEAEEVQDITWTEDQLISTMHAMTHQKVQASEKWTALEMTPERIAIMIEIVEYSEFPDRKMYLKILTEWSEGNFSTAAEDHNFLWRKQGGTIGKATGLLSHQEEAAYVEKNFR